jgi:SAM-dependent methyltransferase
MLDHDERHWWYRGRRRILRTQLDRLPPTAGRALLDVGCGSGRTLDELAGYGIATGVDLSEDAIRCARERGHANVLRAAAEKLPFTDATFDVVTCLDVLEHTFDDRPALRELRRVTRPGGQLILTVPAYPALWSRHDERNLHRRRYTVAALRDAATAGGWDVVRHSHFNALLLLPAATVRLAERVRPPRSARSDLERTPPTLDRVLELPFVLESALLRAGARLPFGLSLLMVLRRPSPSVATAARRLEPTRAADPAGV